MSGLADGDEFLYPLTESLSPLLVVMVVSSYLGDEKFEELDDPKLLLDDPKLLLDEPLLAGFTGSRSSGFNLGI
jgi:hypothetical protein